MIAFSITKMQLRCGMICICIFEWVIFHESISLNNQSWLWSKKTLISQRTTRRRKHCGSNWLTPKLQKWRGVIVIMCKLIEDAATSHTFPYGTEWELCKTYEDKFRTWSQDQAWRRFTICLIKMRVNVLLEAHQRTTQIHLRFKFKSLLLLSNRMRS